MSGLREVADRVAPLPIPVFLSGATGTGKEVLANYIHQRSPWKQGSFVKMSCAALSESEQEAELFGLEDGALSGTDAAKPGSIELSANGTLLLDDIHNLGLNLQAKLLQFLQNGRFTRLGGCESKQINTRVICTANHSLEQEVERGHFREDLFLCISQASLSMPLLKQRIQDLRGIAEYLLAGFSAQFEVELRPLSPTLSRRLRRYQWPGNIRELENVLRRYALLGTEAALVDGIQLSSPTPEGEGLNVFSGPGRANTRRGVEQPEALAILKTFPEPIAKKADFADFLLQVPDSPAASRRVRSPKNSKTRNISNPQSGRL